MNKQQQHARKLLLSFNCYSILQGQPGTGKTKTVGGQGLGLALFGIKSVTNSPSNAVAREIWIKLLELLYISPKEFPQAKEWFIIVYLSTSGTTVFDMTAVDIDGDIIADNLVSEDENQIGKASIDYHALWKHIIIFSKMIGRIKMTQRSN